MYQDSQLQRQQLRLEIARIRRRIGRRFRSGSQAPFAAFLGQSPHVASFWNTAGQAAVSLAVMLATRRGRSELPRALPRIFADLLAAWFNRPQHGTAGEHKV